MIDVVIANPDGFNDYVAHNLPYQQRTGRIAQKEFSRIVPNFKIDVVDRETAIKAFRLGAQAFRVSFGEYCAITVLPTRHTTRNGDSENVSIQIRRIFLKDYRM